MRERILDNSYRLLEEIGRGGFGAVYRAVRIGAEGSGPVAIKLLNRNPAMKLGDYVRFQREATLMSQLVHPGVVSVFELGEEVGSYFIVMEYISGPNLREFVKARGGRLSLPEILDVLVQSAEALEYVHGHSIVHRDIKPQNILVCESRDRGEPHAQVKIVDFGVARLSYPTLGNGSDGAMQGNEIVGTYAYMPPEATGLVNWPMDQRADIYSLGIVAFELLAGKTPFYSLKGDDMCKAHVHMDPPSIKSVRGLDVPDVLERLVRKCIAKHPEDRYQSMFALVCDLKRLQTGLRNQGRLEEFEIATKDFGIGQMLKSVFIGQADLIEGLLRFIGKENKRSRLSWAVLRGGVGLGKSRCLNEIRQRLEGADTRYLYLRFSESEQRLPFQSLTLAINDYLSHFERYNQGGYKDFLDDVSRKLGDGAPELARLIPALRPLLAAQNAQKILLLNPSGALSAASEDALDSSEEFDIRETLDRRYAAPSSRINQSFVELFGSLVGKDSQLVFLLDDIHLADTSTVALFQFMTEQVNGVVNYGFVLTMRDKFPRTNLVLESFIRRLSNLKRRYQAWDLEPFGDVEIEDFLKSLGMENPPAEFVTFVLTKCNGSPLQLHALVKQMLAENVLIPLPDANDPSRREFQIDWDGAAQMVIEFVNIEVLIASLESLEPRDLDLMRVAAVSYDACEFEFLRIDPDFSKLEVETRLISLVRRGIFEMIGDENAPLSRRAFVFAHEKLRAAVLANTDIEQRRHVHLELARRIETIYRNPRREQVLALAKHYVGAGDNAQASIAVRAFLRAVRIYVRSLEHNLAKYYLEKTLERVGEISNQSERMQRLREVFEAEYMIYAAQGNLVAASDVCKSLIEITFDPARKAALQVFWAQLLLGLGRHTAAFTQSRKVIRLLGADVRARFEQALAKLHAQLIGHFLFKYLIVFIQKFFRIRVQNSETAFQAVTLMALSQFHGCEEPVEPTLLMASRLKLLGSGPSRWSAVYAMLFAGLLMRQGKLQQAYKICEDVEYFLERQGVVDAARWVRALKALWLDYPMGRIDRLLALFESPKESLLPTSGLLHFETYGLRAWLRLIAPTSAPAREALANEERRRRRSDRKAAPGALGGAPGSSPVDRRTGAGEGQSFSHSSRAGQGLGGVDHLLENNNARRVLDSGENGQYTSLALFADALRYALCDKLEPLRRAAEQLRRQDSRTAVGDAFASYAFALQALVAGRQREALGHYMSATKRLSLMKSEIISLPVADGLRLAVLLLPLMAVSFNARGWPWGNSLRRILEGVDHLLTRAEGVKSPRRNAMSSLYRGILAFMSGRRSESFELLGTAINEARTQRTELLEGVACLSLACFCGLSGLGSRAQELFVQAYRLSHAHNWRLLERQVMGMSKRTKINISKLLGEDTSPDHSVSRERQLSVAPNPLLSSLQKLGDDATSPRVLAETLKLAMTLLKPKQGFIFLLENDGAGGRDKFVCKIIDTGQGAKSGETALELSSDQSIVKNIIKLLPQNAVEPVRLVTQGEPPDSAGHMPGQSVAQKVGQKIAQTVSQKVIKSVVKSVVQSTVQSKVQNESVATITLTESQSRSTQLLENSGVRTVSQATVSNILDETQEVVTIDAAREAGNGKSKATMHVQANPKHVQGSAALVKAKKSPAVSGSESRYLVLVAITNAGNLTGWIALEGVSSRTYSERDIEQDLMMLGLHAGHLLGRKNRGLPVSDEGQSAAKTRSSSIRLAKAARQIDGELPRDVVFESFGGSPSEGAGGGNGGSAAWKVYRLKPRRMLIVQWRFSCRDRYQESRLSELVARHLNFFVTSARAKGEAGRPEAILLRLFSDFSTIFEAISREVRFDVLDLNIVLVDLAQRRAYEGVFGEEMFSFGGQSTVENEFLQELRGVLSSDRLVYRERARHFNGAGGWFFAQGNRTKNLMPRFAQIDFVEKYLQSRRPQVPALLKAMGIDDDTGLQGFTLVCQEPDANAGTQLGA